MTPSELRVRALRNIASAHKLVAVGDADNPSNLAGQAAELALKARYCTRHGLSDFPATATGLRAAGIGQLAIHDLDKLLTLCKGINIPRTAGIDWARIADWSNEQKYDVVGAVSPEKATVQIVQTEALLRTLRLFELIERLIAVRSETEQARGALFTIFALDSVDGDAQWRLLIGAPWIWIDGAEAFMKALFPTLRRLVDDDLLGLVESFSTLASTDSMEVTYRTLQGFFGGICRVSNSVIYGNTIAVAYLIPPVGFIDSGHSTVDNFLAI